MRYLSYVLIILFKTYGMVAITLSNMLVLFLFLRPRFKRWLYPLLIALTYLSLPLLYKLNTEFFNVPLSYSVLMAFLGYWNDIMVFISFREPLGKMIFLVFTLSILNRLFTFWGYILHLPLSTIMGYDIDIQLSITLVIILMYMIILLVYRFVLYDKRKLIQTVPHRHYWLVMSGIAVSAKLIIDFCSNYVFELQPHSDRKIIWAMISLSTFVLAVLILYFYSTLITMKHIQLKVSSELLAFEKEAQQRYYETQLFNQEELRRMKHDMKGHLNTISRLLIENKKEEAIYYLTGICDYNERHQIILYCDDPYLNTVVSNFSAIFTENHIPFEQEIKLGKIELHHVEMCLILNNALQNALEASLKLPPSQRYVKLQIKTKQNHFLLRISNQFENELMFDGELPCSTKKDDGHGYGLTSIRNAAESLGGFAVCKIEKGMFVLDVAI